MNINWSKNFLNDVYEDYQFNPKEYVNTRNFDGRRMGDKPYRDPDAYSKELYDLQKLLWEKNLPNGEKLDLGEIKFIETPYYSTYRFSASDAEYGSDYIGPSNTGASVRNVSSEFVGHIMENCRTLGGHIIWPSHYGSTINTTKAKSNDRMDITLCELKDYYKNSDKKEALYPECQSLRNAFIREKTFLDKFVDFDGFVDFFLLRGSFVNENGDIIMFGPLTNERGYGKYRPYDYESFMKENEKAIIKRLSVILEYVKKHFS